MIALDEGDARAEDIVVTFHSRTPDPLRAEDRAVFFCLAGTQES
jgi:hypothetical protein